MAPASGPINTLTPIQPSPEQKRKPRFDPDKNHGRYASSDYPGCPSVPILHDHLKSGDGCPACVEASLHGKLHSLKPEVIVQLQGNPIITGTRYERERFRCALCGNQYNADMPNEIAHRNKYDETCRSALAIARYYSGQPFKRIETLQELQGVPVADATQWDQIMKLYSVLVPVYLALEEMAANGQLISYDDTGNRILSVHGNKKAVHTTAFISTVDQHMIYLFYTSQRHAGQNMEALVGNRTTNDPLLTMTDASSQNFPKKINEKLLARWIMCFCLVHGRRKFYEVLNCFSEECEFVLGVIGKIYKNESHCKKNNLTPQQRLAYHQEHSAGPMNALRVWLNNQLLFHLVEDNSGLGEATRYMLRHFDALTRFLSVAGAPIDNSLCEQAIKVAIRHRRNSLFYKTFKGAQVGDCMMSIIHTAAKNNVNIFDYLNVLQRYEKFVQADPDDWLPWNYQSTLNKMTEGVELHAA